MNDLIKNKEQTWNSRLKKCIETKGYSQKQLAEDFNKRFHTKCTQKDISRWINVGSEQSSGTIGFPSYQNMAYLADFFEVSVAYLTGETDFIDFDYEKTSSFIGLNQDSIKALRQIANFNAPHSNAWQIPGESNEVLNKFVTANDFFYLIQALAELNETYSGPNKEKAAWEEIYKRFDKDLIDEAIDKRDDHYDEGDPTPSPELCEAVQAINTAIDLGYEDSLKKEYDIDVFKYRLERTFAQLIENLYPSK